VQDGYRAAAESARPPIEIAGVPGTALRQPAEAPPPPSDSLVLVRITYAAVERDALSADDPIHREGTGVLFLDRAGRSVVVTARSLVDGAYTESDLFGGDPEVDAEQIKVMLPNGSVLRAGRVWVEAGGADLAALVLEEPPPDLAGTPAARLVFGGSVGGTPMVRAVGPDGTPVPATELAAAPAAAHGGAVLAGELVIGVFTGGEGAARVVALELLPVDLRPL
jgi:hypothetical protein